MSRKKTPSCSATASVLRAGSFPRWSPHRRRRGVGRTASASGRRAGSIARPDVDRAALGIRRRGAGFVVDCWLPVGLRARPSLTLSVEADRRVRRSHPPWRARPSAFRRTTTARRFMATSSSRASTPSCGATRSTRAVRPRAVADYNLRGSDLSLSRSGRARARRWLRNRRLRTTLSRRGRPWTGCEIRADYVAAAAPTASTCSSWRMAACRSRRGASMRRLQSRSSSMPKIFRLLEEVRRVAPRMALVSVPNFEVIPVTATFYALPWHMLEPDHRNFFAHGSLAATLRSVLRSRRSLRIRQAAPAARARRRSTQQSFVRGRLERSVNPRPAGRDERSGLARPGAAAGGGRTRYGTPHQSDRSRPLAPLRTDLRRASRSPSS